VQVTRRRQIIRMGGTTLLVALAVASCTSTPEPAPKTGKVERASVTTGVSAPGSLTAITEQNMGFPKGGKLTSVLVKVGDRVNPGQPLATVDDFSFRQILAQQQAQLNAQQAMLDKLRSSPNVSGAKDSLSQAKDVLDATKKQADAVEEADEQAIDDAERQLSAAKRAKDQAEQQLRADQATCPTNSPGLLGNSKQSMCQSKIQQDQQAVSSAKQAVVSAQTNLNSAKQKLEVDKASGDLSVENAQQGVVSAQNTANSASSDRPFDIAQQSAMVANARAAVQQAQRDVDDTTLRAPVAGTVSVINGVVGEFLSPSSGTTALAPGSDAAIPGAGGSSAVAPVVPGNAASPTRPGGAQFLVLDNVSTYQLVVPFNESDASTIVANQKVNVTFDAIPDLTVPGTVLSTAPTGTAISGVVSYYVTVALTGNDPRLKAGQTAHANVVTNETPNVLTVPSAAVRKQGSQSVVTVLGPDGTPRVVPFQPGIVGMDRTEVVSGLDEGQQVLLPPGR
jgi:HlyD family secretion protein